MRRQPRRSPSVHSLDSGRAAARALFRCPGCGTVAPKPLAGGPGAPLAPVCLSCGFLAGIADAGMRDSLRRLLLRAEALSPPAPDASARLGASTSPEPAAATGERIGGSGDEPGRPPAATTAEDALGMPGGASGEAKAPMRHGVGVIERAAAHVLAARAHMDAARAHVGCAAAHVERARACVEFARTRRPGGDMPGSEIWGEDAASTAAQA